MPEASVLIKMVALGMVAGVCSGLLGIGRGLIIVPASTEGLEPASGAQRVH